jgi:hypothetical protein
VPASRSAVGCVGVATPSADIGNQADEVIGEVVGDGGQEPVLAVFGHVNGRGRAPGRHRSATAA